MLLTVACFASVGALGLPVEATVLCPLQGIGRGAEALRDARSTPWATRPPRC